MKKSLLALAVLGAFAGAAQAQTSVTVYGSYDAGVRHVTNAATDANGNAVSTTKMSSSGTYNSNRFGFKGVEDLGGGLNAHFTLEGDFNSGTGAQAAAGGLFRRSAFVGLGGSWGSLDLGRHYSVEFETVGGYDPFNYKYTGIIPLATLGGLTRLDNDIHYTGTFGPITARAEYALGEVAGSTSNGATQAVGGTYTGGPISVGAAYTQQKNNSLGTSTAPNYQNLKDWTIGGAYSTGPFRVALGYNNAKQDTGIPAASSATVKDWWLGGSYAMTPAAALTAGYYQTKGNVAGITAKRKLFIIGSTYALSKRTNFYADIDNARFDLSPGTAPKSQTGISVGINHLF